MLLAAYFLLVFPPFCSCHTFVFVPMHQFVSHAKSMLPIARALVDRGHRVEFLWGGYDAREMLITNGRDHKRNQDLSKAAGNLDKDGITGDSQAEEFLSSEVVRKQGSQKGRARDLRDPLPDDAPGKDVSVQARAEDIENPAGKRGSAVAASRDSHCAENGELSGRIIGSERDFSEEEYFSDGNSETAAENGNVYANFDENIIEHFVKVTTNDSALRDLLEFGNDTGFAKMLLHMKIPLLLHEDIPIAEITAEICYRMITDQRAFFDKFLARRDVDMFVVDTHFSPCGYYLATMMKIPTVMFSTTFLLPTTLMARGLQTPISYPQIIHTDYDILSFYWRTYSTVARVFNDLNYYKLNDIVNDMLCSTDDSMIDFGAVAFERESKMVVGLASQFMDFPRGSSWDVFHSDVYCPENVEAELSLEISKFVGDEKSKGTVVIAFGHFTMWDVLPQPLVDAVFGTFDLLPDYRFILQYNGVPRKLPENVRAMAWLPQSALLKHAKTKVFVSHMGLKSFTESMCSGVPLVCFPLFAEQPSYALVGKRHLKVCESAFKFHETADSLAIKIREVSESTTYVDNVKRLKLVFKDSLMSPVDLAAFKIEFALKHQASMHLFRMKGARLSNFVYFSLDVILFLVVISLVTGIAIRMVFVRIKKLILQ